MDKLESKEIWTIGHSTREIEEFLSLLKQNKIEVLVDVRNFPGSRKYPHFNQDSLAHTLKKNNIRYIHLKALGGRRKVVQGSKNDGWRSDAFRGYADYMETQEFSGSFAELERIAADKRTAFMCSEAVWWRCHRSLISDLLKSKGWKVMHILSLQKVEEHPYTSPARIVNGELSYQSPSLFGF